MFVTGAPVGSAVVSANVGGRETSVIGTKVGRRSGEPEGELFGPSVGLVERTMLGNPDGISLLADCGADVGNFVGDSVRSTVGLTVGYVVGDIVSGAQHASTQPTGIEVDPSRQSSTQKGRSAGGTPSSSHAAVHRPGWYGPPGGQIIRHIDGLIGPGRPSGQTLGTMSC